MDSLKTIAVIPARGGSKRIPRKNVRNFRGKPPDISLCLLCRYEAGRLHVGVQSAAGVYDYIIDYHSPDGVYSRLAGRVSLVR